LSGIRVCPACRRSFNNSVHGISDAFLNLFRTKQLTESDLQAAKDAAARIGTDLRTVLKGRQLDLNTLLHKQLAFAMADGVLSESESRLLRDTIQSTGMHGTFAKQFLERIHELDLVRGIRSGKLQRVQSHSILTSGQICYYEAPAFIVRNSRNGGVQVPGVFSVTDSHIYFASAISGVTVPLNKIMQCQPFAQGIQLHLSQQKGAGLYYLHQPVIVSEVVHESVRQYKRISISQSTATRHIPHDVKSRVWQRDGGRCVQCGDNSYLEFDHIIPHSLGGSNSDNNIQVLCRNCNLQKGARI